jgi:predicted tellurium resistance membrane protein TerC
LDRLPSLSPGSVCGGLPLCAASRPAVVGGQGAPHRRRLHRPLDHGRAGLLGLHLLQPGQSVGGRVPGRLRHRRVTVDRQPLRLSAALPLLQYPAAQAASRSLLGSGRGHRHAGIFIAAGIGLLARFAWISYVFAAILLFASIRLVIPSSHSEEAPAWIRWLSKVYPVSLNQDHFFVVEDNRRTATVLFLTLIAIELTDVVFALDSIPAVLSITTHPFIAYTSNIMAVMGLRSLYFLLVHFLTRLRFLHYGLAVVLAFAAFKMLAEHWLEIGPVLSLGVIVAVLGITVGASLWIKPKLGSLAE